MSPIRRYNINSYKTVILTLCNNITEAFNDGDQEKVGELLIYLIECSAIILKHGEILENCIEDYKELTELRDLGEQIVNYLTSLLPPNMNILRTELFKYEDKLTPGILLLHILGIDKKNFLDYDKVWYDVLDRINEGTLDLYKELKPKLINLRDKFSFKKTSKPRPPSLNILI